MLTDEKYERRYTRQVMQQSQKFQLGVESLKGHALVGCHKSIVVSQHWSIVLGGGALMDGASPFLTHFVNIDSPLTLNGICKFCLSGWFFLSRIVSQFLPFSPCMHLVQSISVPAVMWTQNCREHVETQGSCGVCYLEWWSALIISWGKWWH